MKTNEIKIPRLLILFVILAIFIIGGDFLNDVQIRTWYYISLIVISLGNLILTYVFDWFEWWVEEVDILKIFKRKL